MAARGAAFPRRYPMIVIDVHDGDTCAVLLDQGGDSWWRINLRLHGLAARELRDPGGPEARDALARMLAPITPRTPLEIFDAHWQGECESLSWDKYGGRVLGRIWIPGWSVDVAAMMIQAGYGAAWDGKGSQPKPPWPLPTSP
jgi:endonuclease YncB( thermonuclease family)